MYQIVLVMIIAQSRVMMQQNFSRPECQHQALVQDQYLQWLSCFRQPEQWLGIDICTGYLAPG